MEARQIDPAFIYSYLQDFNLLFRTDLATGDQSAYQLPSYPFMMGCYWSELLEGSLFITGGFPGVKEVVRIDTLREFAITLQSPMITGRGFHCAVYHKPHLYSLGGAKASKSLEECERYLCEESRWEALPPLPTACRELSAVVHEESLYALGGYDGGPLDLIQKLSLDRLTWEVLQVRLPQADSFVACFQHNSQSYFALNGSLYSLSTLQPIKTIPEGISSYAGPCYYSSGTLYCSFNYGEPESHEIGSLTSTQ